MRAGGMSRTRLKHIARSPTTRRTGFSLLQPCAGVCRARYRAGGHDQTVAGEGPGGQLLLAAALRRLRVTEEIGGVLMVIVEAKNERATQWYRGFGAEPLADQPLTLVAPLTTFADALQAAGRL